MSKVEEATLQYHGSTEDNNRHTFCECKRRRHYKAALEEEVDLEENRYFLRDGAEKEERSHLSNEGSQ